MRIAFLAPDIDLSAPTGDAWHVKDLTTALVEAGCSVDLVVAKDADWGGLKGLSVHQMSLGGTVWAALRLWRVFRSRPPEILYERRESPKLSALLAPLLRRPYYVEINGLTDEEKAMQDRPPEGHAATQAMKMALRGWLLRRATGIVTVTEGLRKAVVTLYGVKAAKVKVVSNGVDLNLFRPVTQDTAMKTLGLDERGRYVVFVGNLVAWQGVHTLLAAIAMVRQSIPEVHLLVVGDGAERKRLERLADDLGIRNHVTFTGWVPREQVPLWISAANAGVMPSTVRRNLRIGSSALKLREYLACGRPVVATNLEGGGPLIESEGIGIGTRGDDPEDLARALGHLLRDTSDAKEMGARARAYAQRELSWTSVAQKLLTYFQRPRLMTAASGSRWPARPDDQSSSQEQ